MDNLSEDEFLEVITLQEEYLESGGTAPELQRFYDSRTSVPEQIEKSTHKLFRK